VERNDYMWPFSADSAGVARVKVTSNSRNGLLIFMVFSTRKGLLQNSIQHFQCMFACSDVN